MNAPEDRPAPRYSSGGRTGSASSHGSGLGQLISLAAVGGLIYLAVTFAPGLVASAVGLSIVGAEALVVVSVAVVALIIAVKIAAWLVKVLFILLVIGAVWYAVNHAAGRVPHLRHHHPHATEVGVGI